MKRYKNDLTAERVRELFELRDGELYWRESGKGRNKNLRAGGAKGNGYRSLSIDRSRYHEHRVIYLYVHGGWPPEEVDHKHGIASGNCPSNLRAATRSQNGANQKLKSTSTTGLKGVTWHKKNKKWTAKITVKYRQIYLGSFDCPAAAHFAYVIAADKAWGEFARAA